MVLTAEQCIQINQAVFSFANAYRTTMQREGFVERTGLNLADRSMLMVLGQTAPTTSQELSRRMDINPGTISVHVQRLVEKGLVERRQDEADRRNWWLELTEAGRTAYRETIDAAAAYTLRFLEPLSSAEQRSLHAALLKVAQGLGYEW